MQKKDILDILYAVWAASRFPAPFVVGLPPRFVSFLPHRGQPTAAINEIHTLESETETGRFPIGILVRPITGRRQALEDWLEAEFIIRQITPK
jgi:hypothetical protein